MKIDSFLKIGHSHTICQDYILSGTDPCPYIILSDGCSGSKDSDIGSRILCHTALTYLKDNQSRLDKLDGEQMGLKIILDSAGIKNNFHTKHDSLDATLTIIYYYKNNFWIYMFGDGVVYWKSPREYYYHARICFKPNIPAYLRYKIYDFERYQKEHVVSFIDTTRGEVVHNHDPFVPYTDVLHKDDIETLIITSDGIESFMYDEQVLYKTMYNKLYKRLNNWNVQENLHEIIKDIKEEIFEDSKSFGFGYKEIMKDICQFKNTNGIFLKRRVKKLMRNYLKQGFVNDDDLAIGCFHTGE